MASVGTDNLRVVFDTNVIVSAALTPGGTAGRCLAAMVARGRILLSESTVRELADVLLRDKFDRYASRESREAFFLSFVDEKVEMVDPTKSIKACRDPKDDKFLEIAVSGKADYLVTGDEDLLVLNPFRGIPILTPAAFLAEKQTDA